MTQTADQTSPRGVPTRRAALWALAVLTALNLLNYLDRYVVSPLSADLKRDMGLTDTQLGWLIPVFILVYMVAAPLFGAWGDRRSRTRAIALGILIWSLATVVSGLAHGYPHLLTARAVVGIGEAALVAISPALLADLFPPQGRARVYAVFNMAIPVGAALGYVVGGVVGEHFGWRAAFFVAGAPGIALALAALWLPDPPRGIQEAGGAAAPAPAPGALWDALKTYLSLARRGPFMLVVLGYAAYTFAVGGLAYWMPTFLERTRGLSQSQASTEFGLVVLTTGVLGTVAGGWFADFGMRYSRQSYLWFSGLVSVLAAPVALVALTGSSQGLYLTAIILAQLLLFMSTGPINAALVNIVSPFERASAAALTMVTIHVLGDVPSPVLIGAASDHLAPALGPAQALGRAVLIVPVAILVGGLIWLLAAWRAERGIRPGG